jgi:3-methyladenine DNA glycosylase AlkD
MFADMMIHKVKQELSAQANAEKAAFFPIFFKTQPGEYGEGDKFIGVVVPQQRRIAKKYWREISLKELRELLCDPIHECRLTALFMLVHLFQKSKKEKDRKMIADLYLNSADCINNWDLTDSSAYHILGAYLFDKDRSALYELAYSDHLWRQRIAMISTLYFIRKNDFADTLQLAEIFIHHEHDLMHKAVGWMLREIGNRNYDVEYDFLKKHYKEMPRTMLRYAIEKFDEDVRQDFLKARI